MFKHFKAVTLVAGILVASFAVAGSAVEPSAQTRDWFTSTFTDKDPTAMSTSERVNLAQRLAKYAEQYQDDRSMRDRVLYASDQAYQYGHRDYPEGYRAAAQGLMVMQKVDRGGRLEATERLAEMMEGVWAENRRKRLGAGIEYAQVRMQVAQQRLSDLFVQAAFEEPEKTEVIKAINLCKRDYMASYGAANTVLGAARTYRGSVDSAAAQKALDDFLERHGDMLDRIRENQLKLGEFNKDYMAVGADAFPTPQLDPKAALASALGKEDPDPTTEPKPTPKPERPEVASADPKPEPEPTTEPEPEPEPDPDPPAVAQADPAPPSTRTGSRRKTVWQQINCATCGEGFVPEFGSEHKTCYWCRKKDNIFSAE